MFKLFALTFFLFFIFVTEIHTQQNIWSNYTNTNRITALLKDGNYIWIGTAGGLIRYNSATGEKILFTRAAAGFPGNYITSIIKISDGELWVGTKSGGIGRFNGQSWTSINTDNSLLPVDYIKALEQGADQEVWAATIGGGLVKIINDNLTIYNTYNSYLPNNIINCLGVKSNGSVYMGPLNSDLVWFADGYLWGTYPGGPYNHNVSALTIDNQSFIWLTNYGYLTSYDLYNINDEFHIQLPEQTYINTIVADSDSSIWIGSIDNGVFVYRDSGWTVYNKDNSGLPGNDVRAIMIDGQIKWIGTFDGGLARFDGSNWQNINTNSAAPFLSSINTIYSDENNVKWIGFEGDGIWKYDNTGWTNYNTENSGLSDNYVMSFAKDNSGNFWVGTYHGGLNKFDGTGWTNYNTSNSGLSDSNIVSVQTDPDGNLWIATWGGGLCRFDGTDWSVYNSSNSELTDDYIFSMYSDTYYNIWIGTFGSGLFKFDGTEWQVYSTGNSAIPSDYISGITSDKDNNLWIGTWADGIARYDYSEFTAFNSGSTSLPVDYVNCLTVDDSNNVYIGSRGSGMVKFAADDTLVQSWQLFNKYNSGLISDGIRSLEKDAEGKIWIGFDEGIAVYDPGAVVAVEDDNPKTIPDGYLLYQNYPNPFNPATTINYQIPQTGYVTLKVYDILGREVATLVNEQKYQGRYSVNFSAIGGSAFGEDASRLASGVYIYRLKVNDYISSKKMLLIK